MTRLMPIPSYRWCQQAHCSHRWYTASPAECACPKCGTTAPDATNGWPHACSSGHTWSSGGPCALCKVEAKEETLADVVLWVNR